MRAPSAHSKADSAGTRGPAGRAIFLDTNLFVYAAGVPRDAKDPSLKQLEASAQAIILAAGEERIRVVTSLVVLQEILYLFNRWARDRRHTALRDTGRQIVSDALALVDELLAPTAWEFSKAVAAYEPHQDDFNDRLILEAMRAHRLETILTADQWFARYPGIVVLDPRQYRRELEKQGRECDSMRVCGGAVTATAHKPRRRWGTREMS